MLGDCSHATSFKCLWLPAKLKLGDLRIPRGPERKPGLLFLWNKKAVILGWLPQTEPALSFSFGQWSPTPVLCRVSPPLHTPHPFAGTPGPLPTLPAPLLVDFAQHLEQLQPPFRLSLFFHLLWVSEPAASPSECSRTVPFALSILLPRPYSSANHFVSHLDN